MARTIDNAMSRKTHCPRGHAYDEANTRRGTCLSGPTRVCRTCARDRSRRKRSDPNYRAGERADQRWANRERLPRPDFAVSAFPGTGDIL